MVRVLQCHHFSGQDVFRTDNEPLTSFSAGGLGFIATDQCYIEVYHLVKQGCPRAYRFPTVAPVRALVYSEADDFIATLEENQSGADAATSIRVYLNWRSDLSQQPMRASIAGHMTSLRHTDEASKSRFEVVEVPLKGKPGCITVDAINGTIAVGLDETLLVYGLCTKTVAETLEHYQDIKCILELEFSFPIHQVAMAGDYLAVRSQTQVQVVMFKVSICHATNVPGTTASKSKSNPDRGYNDEGTKTSPFINGTLEFVEPPCQIDLGNETHATENYIVEDEHCVTWTFDETDSTIAMAPSSKSTNKMASVAMASAQAVKTIVLKGLATVKRRRPSSTESLENGELLGPVDNPTACPVTVEYEAVCKPSCEKRGHVAHGVRTCLYRKFGDSRCGLHSLQLVPVYMNSSQTQPKADRKCCVLCSTADSHNLVGMSAFMSTAQTGYLYNVYGSAELLATYPYTGPASKVSVSDQMVYAVTQAGLEIYTSHCLAFALHFLSPMDDITNTLPPARLEPCLIGLQPFIGAQEVTISAGQVLLLNKDVTLSSQTPPPLDSACTSWSMYVLRCPSVVELCQDMMELGSQHRVTSPPTALHLYQEAHLLARTHHFQHGKNNDIIHGLICETAACLGDHYSRLDSTHGGLLTLPYYVICGYNVGRIMKRVTEHQGLALDDIVSSGLLRYLDYMIFTKDTPIKCSEEDGDLVLRVYSLFAPKKLSSVVLRSALSHYSPEKTFLLLQTWMNKTSNDQRKDKLDGMALAVLHLKTGQPEQAEQVLFSLSQEEICATCVKNPWVIHEEYTLFSPLAQMLCRHDRHTFVKVLVSLLDIGALRLNNTLAIFQSRSQLPLFENRYVMEYLEQVLASNSREIYFAETSKHLINIYISHLRKWTPPSSLPSNVITVRNVIPKGQGHFAKRFMWLDYLPPFTGPDSLLTPCVGLQGPRTDLARTDCTCCHCNCELLKLQSLLSSPYVSNESLQMVLTEVKEFPDLHGHWSLRMVCMERLCPLDAIDAMLAQFPSVLPHFARDLLASDTHLCRHLVDGLNANITGDMTDGTKEQLKDSSGVYIEAFKSVLSDMAEVLSEESLTSLIPVGGNSSLFDSAIYRTQEKQKANILKERIITRAGQLEQYVQ